jgi:hypothetical protein
LRVEDDLQSQLKKFFTRRQRSLTIAANNGRRSTAATRLKPMSSRTMAFVRHGRFKNSETHQPNSDEGVVAAFDEEGTTAKGP